MSDTDKVYAEQMPHIVDFVFDDRVAAVFSDMIRRSVPGYEAIISLLGVIAERTIQADSIIYDLGCSLGASMLSIQSRISDQSVRYVGVDNSAPMLETCRQNLGAVMDSRQFSLLCCDVRDVEIKNASLVILNFTLQFLNQADRLSLMKRIYAGLNPAGALVLSEKICFKDPAVASLQQSLHDQFKSANGYSELEISQKRTALENVMVLDDGATHLERLRQAGFSQVGQWFQAFNFCSFIAIK